MKKSKSILTVLAISAIFSIATMAQVETKVIAVVNKAEWCPVCQKHDKNAMMVFKENNMDKSILFVANDLTNDESKMKSAKDLKMYGLEKEMSKHEATGVVYFFNPKTKELITKVRVSAKDEKLKGTMNEALMSVEQM